MVQPEKPRCNKILSPTLGWICLRILGGRANAIDAWDGKDPGRPDTFLFPADDIKRHGARIQKNS
jgi:hypothetical protein